MAKVNCIQPSMTKARVIIELKSQAYVEELVAEHSSKHTVEHNNKQYAIPLVPYDNAVEVKVADLPSYFATEAVAKHLAPYGDVVSTQEEVWKNFWPGLPTGVRLIRMRIKKPIPSYVPMATHTAFISHRNQIRTCKHCVRPLHIGRTCNEARKELGMDINSRLTAAQVVQGNIPPPSASSTESDPPPSSSLPSTSVKHTENENNTITNKTLVTAITDRIITRSASSNSLRNSQVAESSRTSSPANIKRLAAHETIPPNTSEHEISDDADEDMEKVAAAKRQLSSDTSDTQEPVFQQVKRKSRSKSKHNSSSR